MQLNVKKGTNEHQIIFHIINFNEIFINKRNINNKNNKNNEFSVNWFEYGSRDPRITHNFVYVGIVEVWANILMKYLSLFNIVYLT